MCIRDRYKALDAQYAKEQDALEIEIAELEKAVTGYEPVSYTHLSLRTAASFACRISLSITNIRLKRRSRRKAAKGKYRSVKKESL